MTDLGFAHRFVPAERPGLPPLLLLHGTGGDEDDLLPVGRMIAPGAALLSPRGRVSEGGMPRFFQRLAEGIFDPAEVRRRADELAAFVVAARTHYGLTAAPVAVGFSNGANVAAVILARQPGVLAGGILLRPMLVLDDPAVAGPGGRALILSGTADPIVPAASADALAALLAAGGIAVDHRRLPAGHNLTREDMAAARDWLAQGADARP